MLTQLGYMTSTLKCLHTKIKAYKQCWAIQIDVN